MPKRYSEEERKSFCERWKTSGQSKNDFCEGNKISRAVFYGWLRKYSKQMFSDSEVENAINFLPIEVANEIKEDHVVEISLPKGILIRVKVSSISQLVRELTK